MIFTFGEQNAGRIYHSQIVNKDFKQVRTFGNSLNKSEVKHERNNSR